MIIQYVSTAMSHKTTAANPEVPADVLQFAIEHQIDQYIPAVLEMTRRLFPSAERITVYMEQYMDDEDDWRIRIETVVPESWANAIKIEHRWLEERCQACPSPNAAYFLLRLEAND